MVPSRSYQRLRTLGFLGLLLLSVTTPAASDEPGVGYGRGDIAPKLTLMNQYDEPVSLSDFRGKTVLMTFAAVWCPPCWEAAPAAEDLVRALNRRGEPAEFVEVLVENDYGDPSESIDAEYWALDYGLTSPVLSMSGDYDSPGIEQFFRYSGRYGGPAYPTVVLLTPHGRIINGYTGFSSTRIWQDLSLHRAYEPRAMTDWLLVSVERLQPRPPQPAVLEDPLKAALTALDKKSRSGACQQLAAFVDRVQSATGTALTEAQAAALTDEALRIRKELACE